MHCHQSLLNSFSQAAIRNYRGLRAPAGLHPNHRNRDAYTVSVSRVTADNEELLSNKQARIAVFVSLVHDLKS